MGGGGPPVPSSAPTVAAFVGAALAGAFAYVVVGGAPLGWVGEVPAALVLAVAVGVGGFVGFGAGRLLLGGRRA